MINKVLGSLALSLLFAVQANAATLSILGPADVTVGDTFQLQIVGDFSEAGLIAGGITLFWDAGLVTLDNITLELPVVADFSCPGSVNCPPAGLDNAPIVWGEFLGDLIDPGTPETLMATLTFTALSGAGGVAAYSMVTNNDLTGGWFGAGFTPIDEPQFGSLSQNVNPVPLPAAVWFMIGGLGTLLGFRRK